ncbi:high mobility group nucleosome-binding domain-containing protein 5 isoform X2 [Bicyclus anynana]|uniref:High mobility group nucleosome-binding domain-containing protein 5 isoform X2 n=1 Tax=Bicyclus anynana TaxID=110368 RepID=A0A6J1NBL4_BICAN|nr:high mobility group nucleosome-binding domain-containing protein 5 isoform X2 [Bicyclus anynana]
MSQIVTRKGPIGEEKEKDKRQTNSPVKEMKKKIAANAEKEKQAAEKNTDKSAQNEKDKKVEKASEKTDKTAEKSDKKDKLDKSIDKKDKSEKSVDKKEKLDKSLDKKDKAEKSGDSKVAEKKENVVEKEKSTDKKEVEDKKEDKSQDKEKDAKVETEDKSKKPETKVKENGAKVNGEQNGDTVSSEDELQDLDVDQERDEMFPELAYEDSDGECFEPPTPEGLPSRSYTRRSQVKATRTPETPRPASEKLADRDYVPDESKLLKLKDDVPASDRKLRSADSPKPHDKKEKSETGAPESTDKVAIPVVILEECSEVENKMEDTESNAEEKTEREIEVVLEVENEDEGRVKADTNYSKSRVKVSPYRRSARLADNTNTSLLANYTGNNTTMEMDITETSSFLAAEAESPYLSGLRSIRGRRSYKPLREMALRSIGADRSTRSTPGASAEQPSRPTGTVVGRKRKPSRDDAPPADEERGKRARLLERLAKPFRMASTPLPARRAAEIVGINTDLPLSAPVASTETFDPEAIKAPGVIPVEPPTPVNPHTERDSKRCVVM